MRRWMSAGFAAIILMVTACSTVEIEGNGAVTPDAVTGSQTVHGSLYGFVWQPFTVEKCGDQGLFRVETHTNAGLLLVSVLSLGLYVPQTVEWWCQSPQVDDEGEEVWEPSQNAFGSLSR